MTDKKITDTEVAALAKVSSKIEQDYKTPLVDPWQGSPFTWIRARSSRTVGAIGEKLVEGWSAGYGFEVSRTGDSEADRIIHGHRVEIKFSTLWKSGVYKFQQIRNQNYDYCLCLGVSPFEAHAWLIPKAVLLEHVIGKMGQHTGAAGADTAWLSFQVGGEYEWMKPHGGSLSDVKTILNKLGKGSHLAPPSKAKAKGK
jgi:hypothetical protein